MVSLLDVTVQKMIQFGTMTLTKWNMPKVLLTTSLKPEGKARMETKCTATSKTALFRGAKSDKVNYQHSMPFYVC